MSILKYIKGRYLVIKGCRGGGRAHAEAIRAAQQTKPQPREYIERVEVLLSPCTTVIRYKWRSATGEVVGWYDEGGLRALRAKYAECAELSLAPGVADAIRRTVAVIDEALGDEGPPPPQTPL